MPRIEATTAAARATGTPPPRLDDFSRFIQDQGRTNGCGTASLAALMSYWRGRPMSVTQAQLDAGIRQFDGPTSPLNLQSVLRLNGFRAELYNRTTLEGLRYFVDRGVPVMVLIDPDGDGSDSTLHYMNLVDYQVDDAGSVTSFSLADPYNGAVETMSRRTFEARWGHLSVQGIPTGLDRTMLVGLPRGQRVTGRDGVTRSTDDIQLPKASRPPLAVQVADAFSDVANELGRALRPTR